VNGRQVLVCPDCQRTHDWAGDLDVCATCGSTLLVRALGETRCRSCGAVVAVVEDSDESATPGGLADEVAAALDRTFRRKD
jgi:rRNA maturation endonuclease Nob1